MPGKKSLGKGMVERIGDKNGKITQETQSGKIEKQIQINDHLSAMKIISETLTAAKHGILENLNEISSIGHRVVHGGEEYSASVIIDDEVIKAIEKNSELAPLHNPVNLTGIKAASDLLPKVKQVAVFDTAFHQTLAPEAYLYGLPKKLYDTYKIRRYGFHGTSHRYVAAKAMEVLKRSPENTNVISCHLGNGASVTAIENGRSIDTSMGFTPLEGLVMGTRCGDIDPAIVFFLIDRGYKPDELNKMFNKESGLLGLSGISNDLRNLEEEAEKGDKNAKEALDVYAYRIKKYIGAYTANLVKVDALVFTGGVGQNGIKMRARVCRRLQNLGIVIDPERNTTVGNTEGIISKMYSPTTILVIPTNEELQIAIDTYQLLFGVKILERRANRYDVNL